MFHIFFTGSEAKKSRVPFLLDAEMKPASAVNAWLRHMSENGSTSSPHTWRSYAYDLFDFLCFLESRQTDWLGVSNDLLVEYRDVQDQNKSAHTKTFLSRRTINARIISVGRFYTFATEKKFINKNPIRYKEIKYKPPVDRDMLAHLGGAQVYRVPSVTYERLSPSSIKWRPHKEIIRWLNSIDNWPDKLIAKLLYRLGLRREEITSLQIWELPEAKSVSPLINEVSFNITGKGRKRRLVYMSLRDFLEVHEYIGVIRAKRVLRLKDGHDYIFVGQDGAPLNPGYLNRMFDRISKRCGIHLTPHMMRHSFAVFALQHWKAIGLSHPEKLLQARLGHSSMVTTQIYMHLTDELRAEEAFGNASLIDLLMRGESGDEE